MPVKFRCSIGCRPKTCYHLEVVGPDFIKRRKNKCHEKKFDNKENDDNSSPKSPYHCNKNNY